MTKCAHVRFFGDLDSLREASEDAVRFAGVSSRSMTWTPCYDSGSMDAGKSRTASEVFTSARASSRRAVEHLE